MRRFLTVIKVPEVCCFLAFTAWIAYLTTPVFADDTQATVGAQSRDKGRQALAFLPNEVWVHVGDSVTWAFPTDEPHTVTFLGDTVRPPFPVGCPPAPPGTTPSGTSFPAVPCVNSGILLGGGTYTVQFPTAGNFKVVCLLHTNMTGVVHVLEFRDRLPHNQAFYDSQAALQGFQLLSDGARLQTRGSVVSATTSRREVTAGIGEIVATGGGAQTISVNRFLDDQIVVRVGQTVEWTNLDPVTPHTVTFGTEPANPVPHSDDVSSTVDGALRASLGHPGDSTNSGLLVAETQDRTVIPPIPPTPPGVTRFRVTFHHPGVYKYICALHEDLGMEGRVIVVP